MLILITISNTATTITSPLENFGKYPTPKIFWELNWLSQWDANLIRFIKENILIPPPYGSHSLNLISPYNENEPWKYQGTHGEALAVESIYDLNGKNSKKGKKHGKPKGKKLYNTIDI